MQQLTLKGVVVSRFGNVGNFGTALGWSPRKARDIVSGRQVPNARDIERMAEVLQVTIPSEMKALFFAQ